MPAYKPGSVECCHSDGHSSRSVVTHALEQPTRSVFIEVGHLSLPIWPCSCWGLPSHSCYQLCGGLLLHHFTLACLPEDPGFIGGMLSVALSVNAVVQHCPGVTWQHALWSPDFPRVNRLLATIRPTISTGRINQSWRYENRSRCL